VKNDTTGNAMKRIHYLALSFLFALLTACSSTRATPEPSEAVELLTATAEATATSEAAAVLDYCSDCHSNQEELTALAKPVPEGESESKGVG
jgi:cytochrome c553